MKWQRFGIPFLLLALVLGTGAAYFATRDTGTPHLRKKGEPALVRPVDERPLPTARALAPLAITPEEQRFAQEAARIADHEVDLAFADALREAAEQRPAQDPASLQLFQKMQLAQSALADVLAKLDQLKARMAAATPAEKDALDDQKNLLEAEQALNEDEIEDAQQELIRTGADRQTAVQRQRDQHEAAEHELEQQQTHPAASEPVPDLRAGDVAGQIKAWLWLRNKRLKIEAARAQAQEIGGSLATQHQALQAQVHEQKPQREDTRQRARDLRKGGATAASKEDTAAAVSSLKYFSLQQRLLSGLDKRMQDELQQQQIYSGWIDVTAEQQRSVVHLMLRSLLWVLLVAILVYIGSLLVDRIYRHTAADNRHLLTLRGVIRFSLQTLGVLIVAFVILGVPAQMPTILGLAGAGLTVALKDFIVGFFGWFVLMGRNGIRVGDWVEINGVVGEVIEIGLLRTVLMETGNWTDTGHPTGRKVAFVNSFAIEGHFFNFSTAGQWLWDEVQVVVGQGENPYPLVEAIQHLVEEETRASAAMAEQEWKKSASYRKSLSVAPAIHLRPLGSGVEMQIRYITSASERYVTRSRLYEKIVGLLRGGGEASRTSSRP